MRRFFKKIGGGLQDAVGNAVWGLGEKVEESPQLVEKAVWNLGGLVEKTGDEAEEAADRVAELTLDAGDVSEQALFKAGTAVGDASPKVKKGAKFVKDNTPVVRHVYKAGELAADGRMKDARGSLVDAAEDCKIGKVGVGIARAAKCVTQDDLEGAVAEAKKVVRTLDSAHLIDAGKETVRAGKALARGQFGEAVKHEARACRGVWKAAVPAMGKMGGEAVAGPAGAIFGVGLGKGLAGVGDTLILSGAGELIQKISPGTEVDGDESDLELDANEIGREFAKNFLWGCVGGALGGTVKKMMRKAFAKGLAGKVMDELHEWVVPDPEVEDLEDRPLFVLEGKQRTCPLSSEALKRRFEEARVQSVNELQDEENQFPERYRIQCPSTGLFLGVEDQSDQQTARLVQKEFDGGDDMIFSFVPEKEFYLCVAEHTKMALEIEQGSMDDGANLIQCEVHRNPNQQFMLVPVTPGIFVFLNGNSGKVLTLSSREPGANVVQSEFQAECPEQLFRLQPVMREEDTLELAPMSDLHSGLGVPDCQDEDRFAAWEADFERRFHVADSWLATDFENRLDYLGMIGELFYIVLVDVYGEFQDKFEQMTVGLMGDGMTTPLLREMDDLSPDDYVMTSLQLLGATLETTARSDLNHAEFFLRLNEIISFLNRDDIFELLADGNVLRGSWLRLLGRKFVTICLAYGVVPCASLRGILFDRFADLRAVLFLGLNALILEENADPIFDHVSQVAPKDPELCFRWKCAGFGYFVVEIRWLFEMIKQEEYDLNVDGIMHVGERTYPFRNESDDLESLPPHDYILRTLDSIETTLSSLDLHHVESFALRKCCVRLLRIFSYFLLEKTPMDFFLVRSLGGRVCTLGRHFVQFVVTQDLVREKCHFEVLHDWISRCLPELLQPEDCQQSEEEEGEIPQDEE